jgi:hypothetical protein
LPLWAFASAAVVLDGPRETESGVDVAVVLSRSAICRLRTFSTASGHVELLGGADAS